MKHIFITGISGFLGNNIVLQLLKKEDVMIHGLMMPRDKHLHMFDQYKNIEISQGDICSYADVNNFLSKPVKGDKYLIHTAGKISVYKKHDNPCMKINYEGSKNIADVASKLGFKKFIYISSVDALDKLSPNQVRVEQDDYHVDLVDGVYSKSKALVNNYLLNKYKEEGLPVVIICPSAIFGPNDTFASPINDAIRKFLINKLPAVVKGGYDLVDVRDVAFGVIEALEKGRAGESYLLTGNSISVKGLIGEVAKLEHKKPVKTTIPHFIIKMISPFVEMHARIHHKAPLFTGFSMDCLKLNPIYDTSKAKKEFGYEPRNLEESLKDTIEWMKDSGFLKNK